MQKIIIIPDSFKGTMSSKEVGNMIKEEAEKFWPEAEIRSFEVADGGEGTVDAFLNALGGRRKERRVTGPHWDKVQSFYGQIGDLHVIEMAAAAGLPLVGENLSAGTTTTYGVGELILDALKDGARELILGLGGSATNDGGAGALAALGIKFLDEKGQEFIPVGETLCKIAKIDDSMLEPGLKNVKLRIMCDIDNLLCGEKGAAAVFGPQKGASNQEILKLDQGLFHLATKIKECRGIDVLDFKGGAAAGGMGAGMVAFLNAKLESGIEVVLDTLRFDTLLQGCSLVITGEGKIDEQSAYGKVLSGVGKRAKKKHVPVLAIAGILGEGAEAVYDVGISEMIPIYEKSLSLEEIKKSACFDLRKTVHFAFEQIFQSQT